MCHQGVGLKVGSGVQHASDYASAFRLMGKSERTEILSLL